MKPNALRARLGRSAVLVAALLMLGTFAPARLYHPPQFVSPATILLDPVPLDADAPQRRRVGSLLYLDGWVLRSDNPGFGGLSSLHVEGGAVTALSDTGVVARFALPPRGRRAAPGRLDQLPDGPGPASVKSNRDSESMLVADGKVWVGFEHHNQIWRYRLPDWRPETHAAPPAMARWPENTGPEAMVRLPDGRFLVFAEYAPRADGTSAAVLFDGDPARPGTRATVLGYRPPTGYRATDATMLSDGRLLLLTRRASIWDGLSAKLLLVTLPKLDADAVITGREIATLRSPMTVDNMEGVSVTREGGRTIVWLTSDDNFFPLQRTLLLKFALVE